MTQQNVVLALNEMIRIYTFVYTIYLLDITKNKKKIFNNLQLINCSFYHICQLIQTLVLIKMTSIILFLDSDLSQVFIHKYIIGFTMFFLFILMVSKKNSYVVQIINNHLAS